MPNPQLEQRYFDQLRCLVPELNGGIVQRGESPDFVVDLGHRRIGIELTEFHRPTMEGERPHRQVITLRWRVVAHAAELHRALGGPALYLHASFDDKWPRSKRDIIPMAANLARAVLASEVPPSISAGRRTLEWGCIPVGFNQVWFWASIDGSDLLWQPVNTGWVAPVQAEDLAALVAAKDEKIASYRTRCDEAWLVIVYNVWRSAPAELRHEALAHVFVSRFDRVLWLEHQPETVTEIRTLGA